jgi:hypothetical protein
MPERLTDPRYWKQTTQDIAGAFAAPPKPQGTPGAFIENTSRPTDKFATQIGEQISPTLGAFGMGQLAGDTALRFSEGDYTGAAMNAPVLAMAMMPGAKGKKGAFLDPVKAKHLEGLQTYWGKRTWPDEASARAHIKRRVEEGNQRYGSMFGSPTDPAIVDELRFVKKGGAYALSQAGRPKSTKPPVAIAEEPEGSVPSVDWGRRDLQDDGSPESVLKNFGRGQGSVVQGYISLSDLPNPKGAGIKEGYPTEKGGYDWGELQWRGEPPPAKVRINKNGSVSILDGNHRIAYWRNQGHDQIPVYVIDERVKKDP